MFWFYAVFPYILVSLLVSYMVNHALQLWWSAPTVLQSDLMWTYLRWYWFQLAVTLIPMFIWAFVEVDPQAKFVKERFGNQHPRKGWMAPLGIAAGLIYGTPILVWGIIGFIIGIAGAGNGLGTELTFNGGKLFYKPPVTAVEANRLGNFLVSNNVFNGEDKAFKIRKSGNTYEYRMVLKEGISPDLAVTLLGSPHDDFIRTMSRDVFSDAPIDVHLCDKSFKTLRGIPWQ